MHLWGPLPGTVFITHCKERVRVLVGMGWVLKRDSRRASPPLACPESMWPVTHHPLVLLPESVPVPTGPRAGDYTYREGLEHKCKRDILLGRLRSSEDQTWKRIRPRPTKTSFVGSYYLCKGAWAVAGAPHTARALLFPAQLLLCSSSQVHRARQSRCGPLRMVSTSE